jgi:hypothetical protein
MPEREDCILSLPHRPVVLCVSEFSLRAGDSFLVTLKVAQGEVSGSRQRRQACTWHFSFPDEVFSLRLVLQIKQ